MGEVGPFRVAMEKRGDEESENEKQRQLEIVRLGLWKRGKEGEREREEKGREEGMQDQGLAAFLGTNA